MWPDWFRKIFFFLFWILATIIGILPRLLAICKSRQQLPPIEDPILLMSATKLASLIRERKLSSEKVVKAYIARCTVVNPIINAIVNTRYEKAILEAKNVDSAITNGDKTVKEMKIETPLLGVPVTVKESIAVKGLSNEAGRYSSQTFPAIHDAAAVARLRKAGAIPILVSNTPELCMSCETFNYVTGTTRNPYDTKKTPGGSSGGEAALLASGASVIGLGSDIAGSVRLPAMYCGLFALKPSVGAVSIEGHVPFSKHKDWTELMAFGPMTRYAEDLTVMMRVLNDPKGTELCLNKQVAVQDMKFYCMSDDASGVTSKVGSDVREAMRKVIDHFENVLNIKVQKVNMENLRYALDIAMLRIHRMDVENFSPSCNKYVVIFNLLVKLLRLSKSILTVLIYSVVKNYCVGVSDEVFENALNVNKMLKSDFANFLQDDGVLFYPTFPHVAHTHGDYLKKLPDISYLVVSNSTGLPALNFPVGLTRRGLPVGVQAIANHGCDHLLLQVANEMERAFGGWTPPRSR